MEKCRFCFTRSGEYERVCPVCGIDKSKSKSELSRQEKLTRYFCRGIRVVGILNIIGGIGDTIIAIAGLFGAISPGYRFPFRAVLGIKMDTPLMLLYGIFLFVFGCSLMKYKKWPFYAAVIYYPIMIIICFTRAHYSAYIAGLFELLLFYYIINATSRKILLRGQPTVSPIA